MKGYIFLSLIILVFSLKEDGLGSHFATNPNNQYGKEKTITIDGTSSGWELDMKIAQNIIKFCYIVRQIKYAVTLPTQQG